ncbi:MAG: hybrid sensor histidine kinase/response regulator [Ignavibacterium sp.]|nr:MAG: hybrid sensor histidine kinase/response regulator [Ignavibacterium sp.]
MIIILCTSQSILFAQQYFFQKYTEADGLVQSTVREIYQDSYGRMWFGTVDGISIFNGKEFTNFREEDGLTIPIISGFLEISPGVMLVATLGNGIEVFVKSPYQKDSIAFTIKSKKFLLDPRINQIKKDPSGNIWICTEAGITIWRFSGDSVISIQHESEFDGLGPLSVYSVDFDKAGNAYLGTSKGLLFFDNEDYKLLFNKLSDNGDVIFYTYVDKNNNVWFSSLTEFYQLQKGRITKFKFPDLKKKIGINACIENEAGELIIGGLEELIILTDEGRKIIDNKNGLSEKAIISLYFDSEGNLWIGSLEGVSKLNKSNFRFVDISSVELNYPNIFTTNNKLYLGNSDGLYEIENFKLKRSDAGKKIGTTRVLNFQVYNGEEWFATDKGVFNFKKGQQYRFTTNNGLPDNFVYSINKDSNKTVWLLTQGGLAYVKNNQLYNFRDRTENRWKFSDSVCLSVLSSTSIRQSVVDRNKTLWITSWRDGLFRVRNDSIYRFTEKDGLSDLRIRSLFVDSKNNLWIGTRFKGVFRYDGKKFINYSTNDGLSSNWIFSITEDDDGNFWFCTSKGITRFDGQRWIHFGATEGILGGEILNSCIYENKIWFNSWNQIFCYLLEQNPSEVVKPKVYFKKISLLDGRVPFKTKSLRTENFRINDLFKLISPEKTTELGYSDNTLIFEFAGTELRSGNQLKYEYKLEGFEKDWNVSSGQNLITYTQLPPGEYRFLVYAITKDGVKSELPAEFSFRILTPFWLKWWFITAIIGFFILFISAINYIIYKYKIRQALEVEKLRTKISGDLHDEIGTSLSSISIFSELVRRNLNVKDSNITEMLARIENTARELTDKMSDIVWSVNPGNDKFEDALYKLRDYAFSILESRGINVNFNTDSMKENIVLPLPVRRNLLLIFKELVTNAAKYSDATEVNISLQYDSKNKKISLTVEDNGIGFEFDKIKKGNGLRNIHSRTEELGGTIKFDSSPGEGTRAIIEIPLI